MLYQINHRTVYNYNQSAKLSPHVLRLRPRSNGWQRLIHYSLKIEPIPLNIAQIEDLEGNDVIQIWFDQPTRKLMIESDFQVETLIDNPFIFQLEPWALQLPFDYPLSVLSRLNPYLKPYNPNIDPIAAELAHDILHEVQNNTLDFLFTLNQKIYQNCQYLTRETGEPFSAGITWKKQEGSCRDFSILFIEVCRAVGLGARFVSGYQEGDPDQTELDLHGWVEVYLPGGGWRGYDPTHGLAVSDRHIALAASAIPKYTAPITGHVIPADTQATMTTQVKIFR
ncbi:MAG: transglutaminase N-terminal domain-containing protein [Microcystaceae cyanobacterium]